MTMKNLTLGRREFIRLGALTGLLSLSGCSYASNRATLVLPKDVLPREFLQSLPSSWRYQFLASSTEVKFNKNQLDKQIDLIALGDGWLSNCPYEHFQAIGDVTLYEELNSQAISFLNSFKADISARLLPLAVSPWVLIFRGGDRWLPKARESWEVLLESDLREQVILPSSPRVIMSLADRMRDTDSLRLLKLQARSFDDRNGLNWLLSGKAKVAVLPLHFCLKALASDPRLSIAFPKEGAPLNWTLLLRPKSTSQPLPSEWIKKSRELPLLLKLLARGVIPPVKYAYLKEGINSLPNRYQTIYQFEENFKNSWSLPPLNSLEKEALEDRWNNSSP
ncbi:Periplasmic binding protein-like II superfamily [Prochlorococcus marinus subsp. marinus str. CCMP1375]|uniref:Periplasmic binding protein-like II superfamily n=2 Tax=Prochlorococcaceae TaxID=2881426 RepID=Q7VDE3_PROMA|nr:Periplasmic binding protein-like II superfamily [Prochlorococcus marinus subsp. marinus str. CCMP1375]